MPLDSKTRVTGHHLKLLGERFNAFETQLVTGIFQGDISRLTSEKNIDEPLTDACACFVIRTLLKHPEWAPLPKLQHHDDLVEKVEKLPKSFPLPNLGSYSGVFIGKSSTTSYSLGRGSPEMPAITRWITILLSHWDDFVKEGKDHFLYKLMEDEAHSRYLDGMKSIILSKGWSKKLPTENELGRRVPDRITGKDIKLLRKGEKYNYDQLQIQYLLGAFMPYITTQTTKKNENLPLVDATRSLIIRYIKKYPSNTLLPDLVDYDVFRKKMEKVHGKFPLPCSSSLLGVVIGRSISTTFSLKNGPRRKMPVINVWATIIMNQLDDILKKGKKHFIYKVIEDEAKSRGLSVHELVSHRGWPKKLPNE